MESVVLAATMALLSLLTPSASQEVNTTFPLTYRARAAEGGEQVCSPDEERQRLQARTHNEVSTLLRNSLPALVRCSDRNLGQLQHCPAASCSNIDAQSLILRPSGFYWIRSSSGTAVQVYCDMDRVCGCNSTGGWTRVAYLNMTDASQQCPSTLTLQTHGSEPRRNQSLSVVEKLPPQLGSSYRKPIAIRLHYRHFYHNHACNQGTPPGTDV